MASTDQASSSARMPTNLYDTALCVIPPTSQCGHIEQLRELYDKAYGKWPPHINLIYPFVALDNLPRAQKQIQEHLAEHLDPNEPVEVDLDQAGCFKQRSQYTVFLGESRTSSPSRLETLRTMALQALGQGDAQSHLHLTVGQSQDNTMFSREFLLAKVRALPALRFRVGTLAIMVRERTTDTDPTGHMRLYGIIDIGSLSDVWRPHTPEYWVRSSTFSLPEEGDGDKSVQLKATVYDREVQSGSTFRYNAEEERWAACTDEERNEVETKSITVSSYNVLIDTEYPPTHDRDPLLIKTLLSDSATADVLVLQEVSDDFLSNLLDDTEVQRRYLFTSHAPPSQPDIGPLPSLRNIVILSSYPFSWKSVPFDRKHKGAVVAHVNGLGGLVVAGVHLTAGLTDVSVAAKKSQMKNLKGYLKRHHESEPWIIAGDFNIPTSTYTIDTALKHKSISNETVAALSSIESAISDAGLLDAWSVAHVEAADEAGANDVEGLFQGEEGATFDPQNNRLAAGSSTTSHDRAQRYDRILVRPQGTLRIARFNHFGLPETVDGAQVVASDHYGVRTTIQILDEAAERTGLEYLTVQHKRAMATLSDSSDLNSALTAHGMFPTEEQIRQRQHAYTVLKQVVLGMSDGMDSALSDIPMVMVPVGSFALGVWTSGSDIDCLCIGTISSKTFFKLARQRLVRAEIQGVRIVRKVEANTGTMLELSVNGITMDLQYCPAARVVERWSEFRNIPSSDPIFNLSVLSLRKLKPYRDLLYIQRTLPSLSAFRLAYRCIKLWATQRGLYSSKFGYLGGVHITLMLTWVGKRIAHQSGPASAADLVTSFFHHYAPFDWANDIVYDAFFYKKKPHYHRSAREPMVVLGFHAPNSNVAHTATVPGVQILAREFKVAAERLEEPGMTWEAFFGMPSSEHFKLSLGIGAADFLRAHSKFVKIDIQFWGRTLAKGKSLVGWVESRCISLVVDIHRTLPKLEVHIWPTRFTDSDSNDAGESHDYHGCYLIGLSKAVSVSNQDDKQLAKQALDKALDRFLTQLRTNEKNYDASTCWVDVSLRKRSEVKGLRLDDREWHDYVAGIEPDSDDEEDIDGNLEDLEDLDTLKSQHAIPERPKSTSTPMSTTKLRPASDVLNRLRWDPSLDPSDYIIGYEDRFSGARETGLERWKTEQTDEEFIPQHRILYFKKRDGDAGKCDVIWERATRIDRVFGSGLGAGTADA
ncbi:Poly(A) polymerase type 3 [Clathrospora elynae]|uniref:polynucleotide adenylyltransferase n=1 Tax=Clathrospora elynae TaxID=706981 RepID=A0A6A5TBY4_9PLEO|nr:Poly(A) polymerase type 3 [Clathrospora elynae]